MASIQSHFDELSTQIMKQKLKLIGKIRCASRKEMSEYIRKSSKNKETKINGVLIDAVKELLITNTIKMTGETNIKVLLKRHEEIECEKWFSESVKQEN